MRTMSSPRSQATEEGSADEGRTAGAGALLAIVAMAAAVFAWWGWKEGAYFGTVFYPGAIVLFALLALLLVAGIGLRIRGAAATALLALLGLAAWTLLSTLWTPSPAAALVDTEQAFLYAALFALGVYVAQLLGSRRLLALAPAGLAGAGVGIATTIALAGAADAGEFLHGDATLAFPIGYRNANAAFLLICAWPLIAIATANRTRWELRALAVGSATMLVELAVLAQSRGSLPAAALALLAYLALSPHRLRAGAVVALIALPVLPALSTLLDLFQHGSADATAVDLLHEAALAIAITTGLSVVLAAIVFRVVYPRLSLGERRVRRLSRVVAAISIGAVVVGGALFVERRGGPIEFVDQRVTEFGGAADADLRAQGVRFGANVGGSNRRDFWRVSLDEGADHLLLGGGSGSFPLAYLRDRESTESPEDPHSLEMLVLSELGVPGLLLLALFLGSAGVAAWTARRQGPLAATLVAGGFAAATQWFVHASYDWLWNYPAVTAPAIYMLGVAVAAPVREEGPGWGRRLRLPALAGVVALALVAIPLFAAERYANRAAESWRGDLERAFSDLDRAASLNPLDDRPLLIEGVIATRVGDRERALSAFREARDRVPDNYASHYFIAEGLLPVDPAAARASLARARELNPNGPEVERLERLSRRQPAGDGPG